MTPMTTMPKALIVCASIHQQNTARIAAAIGDALLAKIVRPEDVAPADLYQYDVVGFGSGIYYGAVHAAITDLVRRLPEDGRRRPAAFIFSTSGLPFLWPLWHRRLKADLGRKGFGILGEFHCRGCDRWGPLWLVGGINRRHPDARDLDRAAAFARTIRGRFDAAARSGAGP
jgi:flavodoxin